jgi:hypothetical protein
MPVATRSNVCRQASTALGLLGIGVLLAGCGSSSKAAGPTPAAGTSASSTAVASGAPAAVAASSQAAVKISGGGSFCDDARAEKAQEAKDISAFTADSPAQLQKFEEQAMAELPVFAAAAPSAIKSDVALVVSGDEAIFNGLKAAGFSYAKLDPKIAAQFETPAFTNASAAITAYLTKTCGIAPASEEVPTGIPTSFPTAIPTYKAP